MSSACPPGNTKLSRYCRSAKVHLDIVSSAVLGTLSDCQGSSKGASRRHLFPAVMREGLSRSARETLRSQLALCAWPQLSLGELGHPFFECGWPPLCAHATHVKYSCSTHGGTNVSPCAATNLCKPRYIYYLPSFFFQSALTCVHGLTCSEPAGRIGYAERA